jgi:hypothetical protein
MGPALTWICSGSCVSRYVVGLMLSGQVMGPVLRWVSCGSQLAHIIQLSNDLLCLRIYQAFWHLERPDANRHKVTVCVSSNRKRGKSQHSGPTHTDRHVRVDTFAAQICAWNASLRTEHSQCTCPRLSHLCPLASGRVFRLPHGSN